MRPLPPTIELAQRRSAWATAAIVFVLAAVIYSIFLFLLPTVQPTLVSLVFVSILGIVAAAAVWYATIYRIRYNDAQRLRRHNIVVKAQVIEEDGSTITYAYHTPDGETVEGIAERRKVYSGDTIQVRILPDKPDTHRIV